MASKNTEPTVDEVPADEVEPEAEVADEVEETPVEAAPVVESAGREWKVGDQAAEPGSGTSWISEPGVELEIDRETGKVVAIHARG